MGRMSVATVDSPEFIKIESISPFVSKCEIKVLYIGQNRNGSFIDQETAASMAQTLPGCPIVGYYSEKEEDFRDHGEQVIIDGDGVQFKCLTVPYGFVAPDSRVWFQNFQDTDEFGNSVVRKYLMTEGYLWTRQYEEAQKVINEGRPQSMELDLDTLKGYWSTDTKRGMDFFIITDAIFSKLCILGEDVEPCFEGASITTPDVSSKFSLDEKFTKTMFSMMKELKELTFSLQDKGGNPMPNENIEAQGTEEVTPAVEATAAEEGNENFSNSEGKTDLETCLENQNNTEEFKKKEEKEKKKDDTESSDDSNSNSDDETEKKDEDDEKKKKASKNSLEAEVASIEEKYSLLETQYNELKEKYTSLEAENVKLNEFKANVENKEKDALIESFYMLSDEDKKEVIENKSKYSLDDIEAKLSVICVRKKVNFNLDNEESKEVNPAVTFNFNGADNDDLPPWLKAVEKHKNAE